METVFWSRLLRLGSVMLYFSGKKRKSLLDVRSEKNPPFSVSVYAHLVKVTSKNQYAERQEQDKLKTIRF